MAYPTDKGQPQSGQNKLGSGSQSPPPQASIAQPGQPAPETPARHYVPPPDNPLANMKYALMAVAAALVLIYLLIFHGTTHAPTNATTANALNASTAVLSVLTSIQGRSHQYALVGTACCLRLFGAGIFAEPWGLGCALHILDRQEHERGYGEGYGGKQEHAFV